MPTSTASSPSKTMCSNRPSRPMPAARVPRDSNTVFPRPPAMAIMRAIKGRISMDTPARKLTSTPITTGVMARLSR